MKDVKQLLSKCESWNWYHMARLLCPHQAPWTSPWLQAEHHQFAYMLLTTRSELKFT